jgi:hypothetical protein
VWGGGKGPTYQRLGYSRRKPRSASQRTHTYTVHSRHDAHAVVHPTVRWESQRDEEQAGTGSGRHGRCRHHAVALPAVTQIHGAAPSSRMRMGRPAGLACSAHAPFARGHAWCSYSHGPTNERGGGADESPHKNKRASTRILGPKTNKAAGMARMCAYLLYVGIKKLMLYTLSRPSTMPSACLGRPRGRRAAAAMRWGGACRGQGCGQWSAAASAAIHRGPERTVRTIARAVGMPVGGRRRHERGAAARRSGRAPPLLRRDWRRAAVGGGQGLGTAPARRPGPPTGERTGCRTAHGLPTQGTVSIRSVYRGDTQ